MFVESVEGEMTRQEITLAPGSAHARPSARPPIDMSGNVPAHLSAESPSNFSPNPSEVISEVLEP